VEIMGDFTSWQPVRLARQGDGWWTASLPIPRGTHQMNVRVDGGAWGVPPGLTTVKDEFGGWSRCWSCSDVMTPRAASITREM
jgi:hypothetical protein